MTLKYKTGGVYKNQKNIDIINMNILFNLQNSFHIKFLDLFENYTPTITTQKDYDNWLKNPLQFWQNQLHFAIWCATAGCGVSYENHLQSKLPLTKSLFNFHVYFQTRRILNEMECPLPQDQSFNANDNSYNRRSYERICNEFNVPLNNAWHAHAPNYGMGQIYIFNYRYHTDKSYSEYKGDFNPHKITFDKIPPSKWIPNYNIFSSDKGHWEHPDKHQIYHIVQSKQYWKSFILDKSEGFTAPGIVRINESIRAFVYCLLAAQAQTRTIITSLEAQKQFISLVEDAINSPVDLPNSIKRYQDVLDDASSKVDYVFGINLYMAPSDMKLRITKREGYNNKIMKADKNLILGLNINVNKPIIPEKNEHTDFSEPVNIQEPKASKINRNKNNLNQIKNIIIFTGVLSGLYILWK